MLVVVGMSFMATGLHNRIANDTGGQTFLEGMIIMRFNALLIGLMASFLVTAPALANPNASHPVANPAASLSVANARAVKAATSPKKASKLSPAVGIGVGGALLIGGILLIDDDDDGNADSK